MGDANERAEKRCRNCGIELWIDRETAGNFLGASRRFSFLRRFLSSRSSCLENRLEKRVTRFMDEEKRPEDGTAL